MGLLSFSPIKGDKKKPKDIKFAVIDIETEHWIDFLCVGFYDIFNDHYVWFDNLTDCFDHVFDYCIDNDIESIFAHFGGKFDFNFFLREFCLSDKFEIDSIIPRGSMILSFDVYAAARKDKYFNGKKRKKIVFRDSSALLSFSLRKLAETFKVETQKGQVDYAFAGEAFREEDYTAELFKRTREIIEDETELKATVKKYKVKRKGKFGDYLIEVIEYDKSLKPEDIIYIDLDDNLEHHIYCKKDLLDYMEDDNRALAQCLKKFYEWPMIQKAGFAYTTAGQAVKVWRTFLKNPVFGLSQKVDEFVRKGYFGGRTEIFKAYFDSSIDLDNLPDDFPDEWKRNEYILAQFKKQKIAKDIKCLDVNSLYPTLMRMMDFPNKFRSFTYSEKAYDPKEIQFWEAKVEVPKGMYCPPLGKNITFTKEIADQNFSHFSKTERKAMVGTTKFCFPTGIFHGTWSVYELEYAKSVGVKVLNLGTGALFHNGGKIFKKFIDTMYAIRLIAKRENDGVNNVMTKLMMNSTYGKLGMVLDKTNLIIDSGEPNVKIHSEVELGPNRYLRFAEKKVRLSTSPTNVAISAMVTSYARVYMHKLFMECGEDELYYTDTDSIFTTATHFETGDQLGELDCEYAAQSSCFILPKTYIIDGIEVKDSDDKTKKVAMKGFDRNKIKHFSMDDFRHSLIGEMGTLKINQEPKFATFKTALRKQAFVIMNFDPETDKEVDRKKQARFDRACLTNKDELSPEDFKDWYKKNKKKYIKEVYTKSERSIKSRYDKRVFEHDGFTSKALHIVDTKVC